MSAVHGVNSPRPGSSQGIVPVPPMGTGDDPCPSHQAAVALCHASAAMSLAFMCWTESWVIVPSFPA